MSSILNCEFKNEQDEDRDYINDLIYENIALTDNNIKLMVENRRLRDHIDYLKTLNKKYKEKPDINADEDYELVFVRKDKRVYRN